MSSKKQYQDALKRANQVNTELKKENENLNIQLRKLHLQLRDYRWNELNNKKKRPWYKFW
jgi:hypothetical protein